jgi:hypothetical protein
MLYRNYTTKTLVFYDANDNKIVIHPEGKIDDSVLPEIVFMKNKFIPFGMKRTPIKNGNRSGST